MKTVSQWETGKTFIEHTNLIKLCKVFRVTEDILLGIELKSTSISDQINIIIKQLPEEKQKQILKFLKTFASN